MSLDDLSAFAQNYADARRSFLAAALSASARVTSYAHPLTGRDDEALALDVALVGRPDARKILIISSAVHGVEGFCGSGAQVHSLRHRDWLKQAVRHDSPNDDVALLYLHGVNPYGFSHLRRVTQENVDLNRNFLDFTRPLPCNSAYRALHSLLIPPTWPPAPEVQQQVQSAIATQGMKAIQTAVSGGQYEFEDGLFYGGRAPTWSNLTLRQVLRDFCSDAQHIGWIDIHSGLGPQGVGERIYSGHPQDRANYARCVNWWGNDGATPLTRLDDGSPSSADLSGTLRPCADDELAHAALTKITLEFGTEPGLQVLQAMRAEQWLQLHPEAPVAQHDAIKKAMRDAFYVDSDAWKTQVLDQALQAMAQAVTGLGRS